MTTLDPAVARALTGLLEQEEAALAELLRLAAAQQWTIVHADYDGMDRLSAALQANAVRLEEIETAREAAVAGVMGAGATLLSLCAAATGADRERLAELRQSLLALAGKLAFQQERNANLLLGAMRLRERWMNMLAGMASPTYGAGGRQEYQQTRGIVSRSA